MTTHAEEEMSYDGLSIYDVENALLHGRIAEHQRDRETRERKYVVKGPTTSQREQAFVAVKFGPTGKLVILTIYADTQEEE